MAEPPVTTHEDGLRIDERRKIRSLAWLWVCGILSAGLYFGVLILPATNRALDVWRLLGLFWVLFLLMAVAWRAARGAPRRLIWGLLAGAVLFRLLMLPVGISSFDWGVMQADLTSEEVAFEPFLLYDNDIWRYFWDGHVNASGWSPYTPSPRELVDGDAGETLLEEELWEDVFDQVSYQRYRSVYPPLAQHLFLGHRLVAPASVLVFKLILLLFDLGVCLALWHLLEWAGRPREDLLLYAWNPLVIKEFCGSAHLDVMMIALLVASYAALASRRFRLAAVTFAASICAKFVPAFLAAVILPRLPRRAWGFVVVTGGLLAFPFWRDLWSMLEALAIFAREWEFNPGPWTLLRSLVGGIGAEDPAATAHGVARIIVLGWVAWASWRAWRISRAGHAAASDEAFWMASFSILGILLLMSAAVMPWYLPWALPFAVLVGCRSWVLLTALSLLSYLFYIDQKEHVWWLWVEYTVFALALVMETRGHGAFATRWRAFRRGSANSGRSTE